MAFFGVYEGVDKMIKDKYIIKILSNNPETLPVVFLILAVAWLLYTLIYACLEKNRKAKAERAKEALQAIHEKAAFPHIEDRRIEKTEFENEVNKDIKSTKIDSVKLFIKSNILKILFVVVILIVSAKLFLFSDAKDQTSSQEYTSSVHEMLTPGTIGYAASVSKIKFADYSVDIQKVYTDASKFADDRYILPDGCHWEAIEYSVVYADSEQPYINTKLIGIDGKALRYRGIDYSTRTFDANENAVKFGNTVTHLIAYYAVPDECTEYSILIGDVVEKYGGTGAYFYIKND